MKKIYLVILLLGIWITNCLALESEISIKKSFLIDTSNKLNIENIHLEDFKSYTSSLRLSYNSNSIWLKFEIDKPKDITTQNLILSLEPFQLNQIEKYEYIDRKWIKEEKGSKFKENYSLCSTNIHCFELSEKNTYPKVVYLKINAFGII